MSLRNPANPTPATRATSVALTILMIAAAFGGLVALPGASAAPSVTGLFKTDCATADATDSSNGGDSLCIKGTGFADGATVTFGGTPATSVTWVDGMTLNPVVVPPHAAGAVNVVVTNPSGESFQVTNGFTYTAAPAPSVNSLNINSGTTNGGTVVTISGEGFDDGARDPIVKFDGVPATVGTVVTNAGADDTITVTTPANRPGLVDVTIVNPDGKSATKSGVYTYASPSAPKINSVSVGTGPTNGGTALSLTGTGFFAAGPGTPSVSVGGAIVPPGDISGVTTTNIDIVTPPHAAGLVDIVVANPDGQAHTFVNGFSYVTDEAPTLIDITDPASNSFAAGEKVRASTFGGTLLTLDGTDFFGPTGAFEGTVTIGGQPATNLLVTTADATPGSAGDPTTLTLLAPPRAAGVVDVVLRNPDGQSDTLVGAVTYAAPIQITGISPSSGSENGLTTVTISGNGFAAGATATIDSKIVDVTSVSSSSIKGTTRDNVAGGAGDVVVTNPDGATAVLTDGFTVATASAPTVTSVSPTSGTDIGGNTITITGTGFGYNSSVSFDDAGAAVAVPVPLADTTWTSPTKITVIVPDLTTLDLEALDVIVTNADGQDGTGDDKYTTSGGAVPTVTSLSPSSGNWNGGTTTTITGTGFTPTSTVTIAGVAPTTTTFVSNTKLTVVTGDMSSVAVGAQDVVVTNSVGPSTTGTGKFTTNANNPTISSLSPSSGDNGGGNTVTITGTNFHPGSAFTIGGGAAAVTDFISPTKVEVTTPSGTVGAQTATVANGDGSTDGTKANAFTYVATPPAPTVTSVSPAKGTEGGGTEITITGTNFVDGPSLGVMVGGCAATPVTWNSATSITAVTPPAAAGPPTCTGLSSITVTNPDGQGSSLGDAFQFFPAGPGLTSIDVASGSTNGGTEVVLTGTGFTASTQVFFGGKPAPIIGAPSSTSRTVLTPTHVAGEVDVLVTGPFGQSAVLDNGYEYVAALAPTIASVIPASGPTIGGSMFTIVGTGFRDVSHGSLPDDPFFPTVTVGGSQATDIVVVDTETITASAPTHVAGFVDVKVTNRDGQSATFTDGFRFLGSGGGLPAPTIGTVSPSTGPSSGGTEVTISGTGFRSGATVSFGGTPGTAVSVAGSTSLTVTTPSHAAGAVDVVVTNPDSQSATKTGGFTYSAAAAPTITDINPTSGTSLGGTSVSITGTNFVGGATVSFGGTQVPSGDVTFNSATSLTVLTPARAAGTVDVVVTNPDTQTATETDGFTFTAGPPPTVSDINPATGDSNGGTEVTITGTGFATSGTVTVAFNGAGATDVVVTSSTQLTATTPGHAAGTVDVVVTNPDGQSDTLADGFEFIAADPPVLSSIDPTTGDAAGGTTVTLTGTAFASGAMVSFGGTDATSVSFISSTELTAETPAHSAGAVDVVVTNPDGQSSSLTDGFTYTGTSPTQPTLQEIAAVNSALQDSVRVTRSGGTNTVTWDTSLVPDGWAGVSIWRINSPAVHIADVLAGTAGFTDGKYADSDGNADSMYLVTAFFSDILGYSDSAITDLPGYTGLSEQQVEDRATSVGSGGILGAWWFWLLIGLGALLLILLVVFGVIMARRGEKEEESEWEEDDDLGWADEETEFEAEDQGADAWSEPAEDAGGDDDWAAPAAAPVGGTDEVHTLECPNCESQFTASGPKPIVTTCPGCGKRGILR